MHCANVFGSDNLTTKSSKKESHVKYHTRAFQKPVGISFTTFNSHRFSCNKESKKRRAQQERYNQTKPEEVEEVVFENFGEVKKCYCYFTVFYLLLFKVVFEHFRVV